MVSRVRERGVGIAGAGAQLFSFSLQSEPLLAQEIPAELDADRHLFRVELIMLNKQKRSRRNRYMLPLQARNRSLHRFHGVLLFLSDPILSAVKF